MTVRAKFYVSKVDAPEGSTAAQVHLGAVCRGVENAMWAQYTPAGSIQMSIKNDLATEQFQPGEEYEVTFRRVAKPALGDGHSIVEAVNMHGQIVCEVCGHALGYTEEQVEKQPHLVPYATEEYRAEMAEHHDEVYASPISVK
jgi:hypothetical protein